VKEIDDPAPPEASASAPILSRILFVLDPKGSFVVNETGLSSAGAVLTCKLNGVVGRAMGERKPHAGSIANTTSRKTIDDIIFLEEFPIVARKIENYSVFAAYSRW
jgi:hypothetical protein